MTGGTINAAKYFSAGGAEAFGGNTDAGFIGSGKGNLTINGASALLNVTGELWAGQGTGSVGNITLNSGTIQVNSWVAVGRGGGTGTLNVTGGTITKTGASSSFIVGASGPGTMTQSGGLVNVSAGDTWIGENGAADFTLSSAGEFRATVFQVARNSGSSGNVFLQGGTLKANQIIGGGGTENVHFDGTQIVAVANQATFISALDNASIDAGGLKIDSNGFNITSNQAFTGTGTITKTGLGTLKLNGTSSYSGNHIVSAGKLYSNNQSTANGNFTIANGAGLGVTSLDDFNQLTTGTVTFGTSGATTLDFDLGNFAGNPSAASLKVTSSLVLNGTVTINVADALPFVGDVPLVQYTSKSGSGSFTLGTLPAGVIGTLVDNNAGSVYLHVTSVALPRWQGNVAGGVWDINNTVNWVDLASDFLAPIKYTENTPVLFNDDPNDSDTKNVVLNVVVHPNSVTFNNNLYDYSLTGTGAIAGSTGLSKSGTASLTLGTINQYTGVTTLAGGITNVSSALTNGGVASPLGMATSSAANLVLAGGTLNYTGPSATIDRGFTVSTPSNTEVSTLITANNLTFTGQTANGTFGRLTKLGAGTLTLSNAGTNVLATGPGGAPGTVRVDQGTLVLSGGGTYTSTGELWVGSGLTNGANLVVSGATLNTNTWLSVGRGNGTAGLVSTATFTGATVTTGNVSLGFDGGVASHLASQALTLTNSSFTTGTANLGESGGSTATVTLNGASSMTSGDTGVGMDGNGTLLINGTSTYTSNNRMMIAQNVGSVGQVTVADSGTLSKLGGWFSIGTSGVGTLTAKNSATVTSAGDFNVGDVGASQGFLNISDSASVTSTGIIYVGKNGGTAGTITQTGGTLNGGNYFSIGRFATSVGLVTVSGGTLNQTGTGQVMIIGEEGTGTLTVSGTGTVNLSGDSLLLTNNATGSATVNLNGGTLVTKQVTEGASGAGLGNFNFNGGLLKAATGANANFINTLDAVTVKAGGALIDSNGNNITVNAALLDGGTGGGFTKSGAGTLTITAAATYTGETKVNGGTLELTSASVLSDTAALRLATGTTLALSHAGTDTVQSLYLGGVPAAAGIWGAVGSGAANTSSFITGTGFLNVLSGGAASPYDTWINTYFPGETNPLIIGKGADPDKDGYSNALEFALGGAPNSGTNNPKVYNIIADSSDADSLPELLLTIAVRTGTPAFTGSPSPSATLDGITSNIQGSLNLGTFTSATSVVTPVVTGLPAAPAGYEYRTFSLDASNGLGNKGFLRVQVLSTP
jgi:autotransporter-associated beta strand protein/T5SS/PEP-CTERM-associated repeat protein